MHINIFLISFVIILGILLGVNDNRRNRLLYIISSSAVLVFVAAMRSPQFMTDSYGIDTLNYMAFFERSFDMNWDEFWTAAYTRYIGLNDESDVGFLALVKIISFFTHDFYIYSLIADLIFFIPFCVLLYRYSTSMGQLIFAFVFYISLVQVFLFGGARQIFAMGFDIMAFLSIMKGKKTATIILCMIGITIHFSSFLFLIPLLMIWGDVKPQNLKYLHAILFSLFPVVLLIPNTIISFMGNLIGMEKYAFYGSDEVRGGATTFIVLIEILSFFCMVAIKRQDLMNSQGLRGFYVMAPLFTIFAPLIISNGSMIRISLYFHLFLILLIPYAIDCMFKKDKQIVYSVVIGVLAFLSMSGGGIQYYFFWQR